MSTWFDLPAEIRQNILEYLMVRTNVKFTLKFLTRRLASKKLKEEQGRPNNSDTNEDADAFDAIASLLLVSKKFLTYQEMETALLHAATVVLDVKTSNKLYEIEKRYRSEGMAVIRELRTTRNIDDWRRSGGDLFPSAVALKKLKGLRKFSLHLKSDLYFSYNGHPVYNLDDLFLTAEGEQTPGWGSRQLYLSNLLQLILRRVGVRMGRQIINWLVDESGPASEIERVLAWEFNVIVNDKKDPNTGPKKVPTEFRFSSATWCVEFTDGHKVAKCPQRLNDAWPHYDQLSKKVGDVKFDIVCHPSVEAKY